MHPSEEIRGSKSQLLAGKRIILGVTGSIAAVETIKLARELIRHGADVIPVMTPAATRIIHPDSLWFATGHKPVCELTGDTEHVRFCGQVEDKSDLFLISPCTANTISKIAHGIDDTVVTTFATTAIGSKVPVVLVPAMHLSMYDHEIVQENIILLQNKGLIFIDPYLESHKAKMASIERITNQIIRVLGPHDYDGKKLLIIGGSTAEPIDEVRSICNTSSGKTALALASTVYHHGANVQLWYGQSKEPVPSFIEDVLSFSSLSDVELLILDTDFSTVDVIIVCAALSDYRPEKIHGKISSKMNELQINCYPVPKILSLLRKKAPHAAIIGFKLEENRQDLLKKAKQLKEKNDLNIVVANTIENLGEEKGSVVLIGGKGITRDVAGTKTEIAEELLSFLKETMDHE